MIKYKTKKLYQGHASVRDYIIEKCIKKEQDLQIQHEDSFMVVALDQLKNYKELTNMEFESKFNGKKYRLYDFLFEPDEK